MLFIVRPIDISTCVKLNGVCVVLPNEGTVLLTLKPEILDE